MAGGIFGRLRRTFLPPTPSADATPTQFFIDDDVVGGLEVLPASVAGWCVEQFAVIADHAARHALPNGAGWSDMYVRPPAPADVASLAIPFAPAAEALGRALPRIEPVITGSLANPQVVHRARAFGPSLLTAVILYADTGSPLVQQIEVTLRGEADEARSVLTAMATIPAREPLLVVDWNRHRLARVDRRNEITDFVGTDGIAG